MYFSASTYMAKFHYMVKLIFFFCEILQNLHENPKIFVKSILALNDGLTDARIKGSH